VIEIGVTELLVLEPSLLDVEMAIAKLKKYKSPGSSQISAELVQKLGEVLFVTGKSLYFGRNLNNGL
jgi:hypothetical protein